jgi:CheY-like chemotaxis protein
MDGYEAAAEIRHREAKSAAKRRTPILALTASIMQSNSEKCLASGMDDFIPKPVQLENLRRAIQRWAANPADRLLCSTSRSTVDYLP